MIWIFMSVIFVCLTILALKKYECKHEWEEHAVVSIVDDWGDKTGTRYHLKCKNVVI